jgi:hypothetical protein
VLAGDYRAVMVFLQISQRRAKLNGLDSPASLVVSHNVRVEMERALAELQQLVLQGIDVGDRSTAGGQHRGHIHPDLTTVMAREETTSGQRDG